MSSSFALKNRYYIFADLVAWVALPLVALALRFETVGFITPYLPHLLAFTIIAIATKLVALWAFGLYRRYWRYASVDELVLIVLAVLCAGAASWLVYGLVFVPFWDTHPALPRAVPLLDTVLTVLQVGGSRFLVRSLDHVRHRWEGVPGRERVVIAGAGNAGMMIARELRTNPQLEMEPVAFVDDNPGKHGKTIAGLPVIGGREKLSDVAQDYRCGTVIIAMPTAAGSVVRELTEACEDAHLRVKTVPGMFEILSGRVRISQIRDVQLEDLLRRRPVKIDERAASELVRGATVIVTGAGGSIGSEICRQAARLGAAHLVLLGHGENSIFDVHNELLVKYPGIKATPVIADVRNGARIRRVFAAHRPSVVFHAAAHKHVPLMEHNPEEAVTNNVLGTRNMVAAAEAVGVSKFVLISTDKAVNPANVMGVTKLLAERLVHDAAVRTGQCFVSVRFGNVLASRGSVVPLFQQQIRAGGPVTVTHPEITRYFMTIPESVQLVLQAAAMGKGGETFVLDMGDPVRIVDLARDLVRLSGYEVGRDVEIVYTGLRDGEKLREELFGGEERVERTEHRKIRVVRNGVGPALAPHQLEPLYQAAREEDLDRMVFLLRELVPEYVANADQGSEVGQAPTQARVSGEVGPAVARAPRVLGRSRPLPPKV